LGHGRDGMPKPHAHVMLTMREVGRERFRRRRCGTGTGPRWSNTGANAGPSMSTNALAELDIDARIDHRS
jgi:hypothetical protein